MNAWTRRVPDAAWVALTLLVSALAFWKFCIIDPAPIQILPRIAADLYTEHYPNVFYGSGAVANGVLPLWNPYQFVGMPHLAVPHTGTFYPGNLIYLFAEVDLGIEIFYIAHLVFAGICFWAFARAFDMRHLSAIVCSLTFMFNGWLLFYSNLPALFACMCWLPAFLLLVESTIRGSRIAPFLLCLAVTSLIFNGATEYTTQNLLAAGLYAAFRLAAALERDGVQKVLGLGLLLLLCILVGVSLASFQVMATVELVEESGRLGRDLTLDQAIQNSNIAPRDLLLRTLVGGKLTAVGVLPFVGIFFGVADRRRRNLWLFALGLGLLSALLVFGGKTFELYHNTPIGGFFRRPHKFLHLVAFAQALMAGMALEYLHDQIELEPRHLWRRLVWLSGVGVPIAGFAWLVIAGSPNYYLLSLATLLALFGATRGEGLRHSVVIAIAVLQVASLFFTVSNPWVRPIKEPGVYDLHAALLEQTRSDLAGDRAYISHGYWSVPGLIQKQGMMRDFRVIGGYEQLALERYDDYFERVSILHRGVSGAPHIQYMGQFILDAESNLHLLDLASTRLYIVKNWEKIGRALRERAKDPEASGFSLRSSGPGDIRVYEQTRALPRAYFAQRAEFLKDPDEILDTLADEAFNARQRVLLEVGDDAPLLDLDEGGGNAAVQIAIDDPGEVVIDIDASEPGFLVLNDAYYPGWKADLAGASTPIYRANFIFRAVQVPAGRSQVRFAYEPEQFRAGLVISGCAALGLLAAAAWVASGARRRTSRD